MPGRKCCMRLIPILAVLCTITATTETPVFSQNLSPVGMWKTIDDETGEERAIIKVWRENAELFGKIEKVIPKAGRKVKTTCDNCSGDKKNQPINGMTIMWGLTEQDGAWVGGYILDPNNGKT